MSAKYVDLIRMHIGRSPSITQAITRPNISFLTTPFSTLRIRDSGGSSLPTIIFACDAPNVLEHYDVIFNLLSPSYRLICLEMPGFGFSYPKHSFDFSLKTYSHTVAYTIEKLCPGKAVTLMFPCAWAYVAFHLATETPALVERLLVNQCPHWDEEQAWTRRVGMNGGLIGTPIIGQLYLAVSPQRVSDGWYKASLPRNSTSLTTQTFSDPARKALQDGGIYCLASLAQTWANLDRREVEFRVKQPTVVMWGAKDRTHRLSNPESVLGYLERGKVVVFPDAGHFPELEGPEDLMRLLTDSELWGGLGWKNGEIKEADVKVDKGSAGEILEDQMRERRRPTDSHL